MSAINVPAGARFTCQGCGRCCKGWGVGVDQATVERLSAHDWGRDDPFEAVHTGGLPYRIRLVQGRCFFLDPDDRCRIHKEISYEAKPPVCKAFPLGVLEMEGRKYARLSFWCPTVTANVGRPLDQQSRWLKDAAVLADRRTSPVTLNGRLELKVQQFERIHRALRQCLAASDVSVRDRLAAGVALLRRLEAAVGASSGALNTAVDRAESDGVSALALEGLRSGHRSAGRRVLTFYLLQDRGAGRWTVVPRLASLVLFSAGLGRLRSRAIDCCASRRSVRQVAFIPSKAGDALLARYFTSKLDSRRYVMGTASVVRGFNLLLAAYAVIEALARLRAASLGRIECDDDDIATAVSAADLLVLEHTAVDEIGLQRRATEFALGSSDLGGGLLAVWAPVSSG